MRRASLLAFAFAASAAIVHAQGYRVRLSASAQDLAFRGLEQDSIAASLARVTSSGALETPDGFAVRCGANDFCYYFRPGRELHVAPVSLSADATLWGFGFTGLSFHTSARLVGDLGRDNAWPATDPAAQILEGYAEYDRNRLLFRAGRQLIASRLEAIGFDGGSIRARWDTHAVDLNVYGGWGLGRAAVVSATSAALNPLDEWRPRDRQIVAGAEVAWSNKYLDARTEYRREVDPVDHYFVSERAALSLAARVTDFRINAGGDYNIAEGRAGSADLSVTWLQPTYSVTGGIRRYRPYFSLWTLWGAFSPVPYTAYNGSAEWRPTGRATLRARAERYWYANADVSTALLPDLVDRGWRLSAGATYVFRPRWSIDGNARLDRGPGSAGDHAEATLRYDYSERLAVSVYGGSLARPLELRYYDAETKWIGARGELKTSGPQFWLDMMFASDERLRPDAGASSLDQLRVRAGASIALGSGADRTPLPPGRPR